ncbi:MAG TPA: hypothetical protein VFT98_18730 [Myxococcota bacterium]|nr:hypothetical protein [Myxococcota bacterium]
MNRRVALAATCVLLLGSAQSREVHFSEEIERVLEAPDAIELWSLEAEPAKGPAAFYGSLALGRAALAPGAGADVIRALRADLAQSFDGIGVAACFIPRHALVATRAAKRVVILICFECGRVAAFSGENEEELPLVSARSKNMLDGLLREHGVPLATK